MLSPSRDYENSTQGYLSLVHMKKGALKIYWVHTMLAPYIAASSMIYLVLYRIDHFCFLTGALVGYTICD